jgi:hypothetical protein
MAVSQLLVGVPDRDRNARAFVFEDVVMSEYGSDVLSESAAVIAFDDKGVYTQGAR